MKPPVARKPAVMHMQTQNVCVCQTVSSFNYFKIHAWSPSMLRPEFFYFLFYRFFQPDVRVGGRKKNKNKIQGRLFFFEHIRC